MSENLKEATTFIEQVGEAKDERQMTREIIQTKRNKCHVITF